MAFVVSSVVSASCASLPAQDKLQFRTLVAQTHNPCEESERDLGDIMQPQPLGWLWLHLLNLSRAKKFHMVYDSL